MTTKIKETATHKPTCNGIVKGRPGKGRVLSLEQRKRCYASHPMTEENTFLYNGRAGCKKCRADSRTRSRVKRIAEAKALALAKAKEDRKALKEATAKATDKPKPRKAKRATTGAKKAA